MLVRATMVGFIQTVVFRITGIIWLQKAAAVRTKRGVFLRLIHWGSTRRRRLRIEIWVCIWQVVRSMRMRGYLVYCLLRIYTVSAAMKWFRWPMHGGFVVWAINMIRLMWRQILRGIRWHVSRERPWFFWIIRRIIRRVNGILVMVVRQLQRTHRMRILATGNTRLSW